ncbi:MAG: long-chain fatty acid--CoA ligase [Candidatus Thorarchaeota archaeon]|nr:long-chain fatty acid--CoA ligase [Candidatus Thorarchaeota archaeon]
MVEHYAWIGDWTARRATLTPNKEAVFEFVTGQRYTYAEMDTRANQYARALLSAGIQEGDRVATYSKNRVELLDLFFACGKTGAIFVPFNIRLAKREIDYLVAKTDPKLFLYDTTIESMFSQVWNPADVRRVMPMVPSQDHRGESLAELAHDQPGTPLERTELDMDDAAMIVFTGGTTGLPKGAVLSHRLVFWNSVNTIVSWGLRPDDVQPLLFPLFHTGGWNVLLLPFFHLGAKTVLMGDFDPAATLRTIESEKCTVVIGVPTMFQMMSQLPQFGTTDFSSVRVFISGGAPCPVAVMEPYWARGKPFKMGYGLTEVGPNNFYLPESEIRRKPSSVGFPVFHCDVKIVDDDGRPVSDRTVGELLLRGPHIFSGYWDEPQETAKTIEPDGWVHTGDLATRDEEGFYFIVGRKKDMFISGGENVFPTEIEEVLYQHPAVLEAAVVGIPDEKWGEVGKAVVVRKPGKTVTDEELRAFLEGRLARYKIPKVYEFRDSLPKSAAGKILKRELR